ncbi:MAG: AAA family ATPase [Deltaproteobacteria bacterium]|nr:AAA family ATPase [Deltaproteobacteria bacterium]
MSDLEHEHLAPETVVPELVRVMACADDLARGAGHPRGSVHLLLALLTRPSTARDVLLEAGLDHRSLLAHFRASGDEILDADPEGTVAEILRQARALAARSSGEVDPAGLLASLLRVRSAAAPGLLRRAGVDVAALRARMIGAIVHDLEFGGARGRGARRPSRPSLPSVTTAPQLPTVQPRNQGESLAAPRPLPVADGLVPAPRTPRRARTAPPAQVALPEPAAMPSMEDAPTIVLEVEPPPIPQRRAFELDPERYPTLCRIGRNLTRAALDGETTPLVGRQQLVDAVIDVLLMRRVNNPCLVGEAGVGKTALVEGLAARIAGDAARYGRLAEAVIVEVPVSALLAGTSLRGSFAERMAALRAEVAAAEGGIIVFIDEIHTLMGAGAGDGPLDAANDLKTALARGHFPLIGATTRVEYRRFIEADPAMERRFQVIDVPEPSVSEAVEILVGLAPTFREHHGIPYSHAAIVSAVELSRRFIPDRALPDKAVAVLDRAGAQARRRGQAQVDRADVARAVASLGTVPLERLLDDEQRRLRELDVELGKSVLGQPEAVRTIARRVARNHAGLGGERPLASFVFAGPPGVGKGVAAAALAEQLYLRSDAVARFDMSDYTESHSVSRLIGSPPGYVGHQQAGLLADALHRRPYRVLLFEELDRAAPEIAALVQQLVETGSVVDNQGRRLDARNAVIVVTTTLSPEHLGLGRPGVGFLGAPSNKGPDPERFAAAVRQRLGGELVSRVDDVVLFSPLGREALAEVARAELQRLSTTLYDERLVRVDFSPCVVEMVLAAEIREELGARWLRNRLASAVEDPLGEALLEGRLRPGVRARARGVDGALLFEIVPSATEPRSAAVGP